MNPHWLGFDRDVVLRAGAGAGKTHALVTLYLHLVAGATARRRPVPPSRIVAISFTDKAAGELGEKIRGRMAKLAEGDSGAERALLDSAAALGVELPGAEHWDLCLQQLGGAPVGTFHRLGGQILRRHAIAAGIDPGCRQLDEIEAGERLTATVERVVLAALGRRDPSVDELVLELGFGAAGHATGLVEAIGRLHARRAEEGAHGVALDGNYRPERLEQDWRDGAARFVAGAERIVALDGLAEGSAAIVRDLRVWLPAFCQRLSRPSSVDERRPQADTARGAAATISRLRPRRSGDQADEIAAARTDVKNGAEALADHLRSLRAAPLSTALGRLLVETEARWAEEKRRLSALDFSDLLVLARDLLRDHPEVRRAEQERVDALLVDEFQDTNAVQADLVRLLRGDAHDTGRLLVVGDRKQSIYEFRGADVGVFVAFEGERLAAGGRRDALRRSFRSTPSLVGFANALFARAFDGDGGGFAIRWDPETDPLAPARTDGDGARVELLTVGGDDQEEMRAAEARALALRFAQIRAEPWPTRDDEKPRTMALLLRGFTQLEVYLEALRFARVPYYVVNGRGFFEAQEVRDLAAALRLLDDPDDRLALVTVLRSPLVALSDETLLRLAFADRLRLLALLDGGGRADEGDGALDAGEAERLARFRGLFRELRRKADRLGTPAILDAIVEHTELEVVLAAGFHGEQRVANLARLRERARAMEESGGDLRGFVRWLAGLTDPDGGGGDRQGAQAPIVGERDDVVRVMTVHQAKGLEFTVVGIGACGVVEPGERGPIYYDPEAGLGLKLREGPELAHTGPSRRVAKARQDRGAAESIRLFYVAATRAEDRLILAGQPFGGRTWRAMLDDALAADPRLFALVDAIGPERLPRTVPAPPAPPAAPATARRGEALARIARDERPVHARTLTVAVTQLADFELCPRRYHLFHVVGLGEHPRPARAAAPDTADPELDPLARGTLAHHLLERADFAADGADLDGLLTAAGYDPAEPNVAELRDHVRGLLRTRFIRELAAAGAEVHRELPFLLAVPGPDGLSLRLRGQIDLLIVTADGDEVTVVDYKHARAPTDGGDDYRFQLEAYGLAAARLRPRARRLRVGLAFLREADPSPRFRRLEPEDAHRFADSLARLGGELARAPGRARSATDWPGRPAETCRAIGCGYLYRCHPR